MADQEHDRYMHDTSCDESDGDEYITVDGSDDRHDDVDMKSDRDREQGSHPRIWRPLYVHPSDEREQFFYSAHSPGSVAFSDTCLLYTSPSPRD